MCENQGWLPQARNTMTNSVSSGYASVAQIVGQSAHSHGLVFGGEGSDIAAPEQEEPEPETIQLSNLRYIIAMRCRPA
jgi:hypothetical protein